MLRLQIKWRCVFLVQIFQPSRDVLPDRLFFFRIVDVGDYARLAKLLRQTRNVIAPFAIRRIVRTGRLRRGSRR